MALQAVHALLVDEQFPAAVETVSKAEFDSYEHWRKTLRREEVESKYADLAWFHKNWPVIGELLRVLVQKLWDSRNDDRNPLAAEIRQRLVRVLYTHWGKDSYPFNFVRDLGAAYELVKELNLDKEGDKK